MENRNLDVLLGTEVVELLHRPDITEIYVNDDGHIRYSSHEEGKVKTDIYLPPENVQAVIELVAGQDGKIVNEDVPSLSTEIRGYGCRFQGEIPPIVRQPRSTDKRCGQSRRIVSAASVTGGPDC